MKKTYTSIRNAGEGYLLILPLLLGCLIFYTVPFLLVLRNSVHQGVGDSLQFVGLENYQTMLNSNVFRLAFGNTMKFLAVALPLIIVLSYAIALMLKSQAKKHNQLKSVLLLPYIMPVVGTVVLVQLLFSEMGLVNKGLYTLGLPVADWLNSRAAFGVVILLYLWKNTGYSVILLLAGLVTIPTDHYDVAALDGATPFQQLRYITVPQMWYSVFFATVFSLINAFKCFREIFLIGGTHPHDSIYMLQHFINNAFEKLNYPKLAVASVLLLIVLTVLFAASYRWVMKKEAYKE
ncbi:MAG: sugar ABC transporter permease [Eubacteriales bacterium]|nr:sugar ABC transporter permease [Eubacteriales bacterium]